MEEDPVKSGGFLVADPHLFLSFFFSFLFFRKEGNTMTDNLDLCRSMTSQNLLCMGKMCSRITSYCKVLIAQSVMALLFIWGTA